MNIKNILFPTDFSESSLQALAYAADMARCNNSKICMMHVIYDMATVSGLYVPHISLDEMYADMEASAARELRNFGAELRQDLKDVEYEVLRGVPYEEILKCAEQRHADIIIIGTHGRKGLDRVLFGSTAERVVRNSSCPVLTVRSKL
jgi:nucleotide-binding universal stress UspA family protein